MKREKPEFCGDGLKVPASAPLTIGPKVSDEKLDAYDLPAEGKDMNTGTSPSHQRCLRICYFFLYSLLVTVAHGQAPTLAFVTPTNGAVYSAGDTIPIVLRAIASNDVFLTADVYVDNGKLTTLSYCCPLCPCAAPREGFETRLQYPIAANGGVARGWSNVQAQTYRLFARGVGEHGTTVQTAPIYVHVVDRSLEIYSNDANGTVMLIIPFGAMTIGGYDLEISEDLRTWRSLGSFSPGAVAAFYWDTPPTDARVRFYRSVYTPRNWP